MLVFDHLVAWKNFSILGTESNNFVLEVKETLLIKRDKPIVKSNQLFYEPLLSYSAILIDFILHHVYYRVENGVSTL